MLIRCCVLIPAVLVGAILLGCGGDSDATNDATSPAPAATATDSPAAPADEPAEPNDASSAGRDSSAGGEESAIADAPEDENPFKVVDEP